ncbi:hypothetical protein MRB53_040933 [Persea americana]|nr:hypothetical protein MRB53_040933 [Persea americana]
MIKAELEEGEILEDLNMNATLPSVDSIASDFVRADLKRHGILAAPATVDAVATTHESEPPSKRVRFELPQKLSHQYCLPHHHSSNAKETRGPKYGQSMARL